MNNQHPFSQSDLDRVAGAVREAESKTSGEIVPYFVSQSDDYGIAHWRVGIMFAAVATLILLAYPILFQSWLPLGNLGFSAMIIGALLLGMACAHFIPSLKRLMVSHAVLDHRVSQRASVAFLAEEVFKTRERTGILIFLSFFERRVVVLGDSGINAKVAQSEWNEIVQTIVKSIKQDKPIDGLVDAIHQCGELLQRHGIERRRDDTDELNDSLRIG